MRFLNADVNNHAGFKSQVERYHGPSKINAFEHVVFVKRLAGCTWQSQYKRSTLKLKEAAIKVLKTAQTPQYSNPYVAQCKTISV